MSNVNFFDETAEQSQVKAIIVAKYFWAWAKVIIPTAKQTSGKIAYVDLFAGPGRYKDGTMSTPLLVLQRAIQDPDMRNMLVTMFNDKDNDHSKSLETAIASLPGAETLKYPPKVYNREVGDQIVKMFEQMRLVPTFFFVDPWGYKGLSLRLINAVLKDWGCDCVFFLNYNRINMGLTNPLVREHMNALFGEDRAEQLRPRLQPMRPLERELTIVDELSSALKDSGDRYILPFCFKNERGTRTSHHLVFVSKHFKGYEVMKEIMAKESSKSEQGVASLSYCPADPQQPTLFELTRPLDDLQDMLLDRFGGQTLQMHEIYEKHNVGTPFIKKNYKDALILMEAAGKIKAQPDRSRRRHGTFADHVLVTF